ncbi:hypothetical protein [Nocardia wallacei]|uniref:hypothetical protein n=1 Tax=Nocardia wallacei TaxID=480035 RepID=UPI0024578A42|nr:hypothetical protein [Nocardia wallacei]
MDGLTTGRHRRPPRTRRRWCTSTTSATNLRPPGAPPDCGAAPSAPSGYESFEGKLDLVAEARTVLILAAGDRRPQLHPGPTTAPIEGIDPVRVVLATRASDANPLITDLLRARPSDTEPSRGIRVRPVGPKSQRAERI